MQACQWDVDEPPPGTKCFNLCVGDFAPSGKDVPASPGCERDPGTGRPNPKTCRMTNMRASYGEQKVDGAGEHQHDWCISFPLTGVVKWNEQGAPVLKAAQYTPGGREGGVLEFEVLMDDQGAQPPEQATLPSYKQCESQTDTWDVQHPDGVTETVEQTRTLKQEVPEKQGPPADVGEGGTGLGVLAPAGMQGLLKNIVETVSKTMGPPAGAALGLLQPALTRGGQLAEQGAGATSVSPEQQTERRCRQLPPQPSSQISNALLQRRRP
jgi:hypothetical protein